MTKQSSPHIAVGSDQVIAVAQKTCTESRRGETIVTGRLARLIWRPFFLCHCMISYHLYTSATPLQHSVPSHFLPLSNQLTASYHFLAMHQVRHLFRDPCCPDELPDHCLALSSRNRVHHIHIHHGDAALVREHSQEELILKVLVRWIRNDFPEVMPQPN
jgi:hypothetical protein